MLSSDRSPLRENSSPARRARQILLTLVRLGVGISLLIYLARSGTIDFRALTRLLIVWPITVAAIALLLLDIGLMAVRLSWLFPPHGLHLPLGTSLQLTAVGFFFTTFLPGAAGGDLAKVYYAAKENRGRRTEIITRIICPFFSPTPPHGAGRAHPGFHISDSFLRDAGCFPGLSL